LEQLDSILEDKYLQRMPVTTKHENGVEVQLSKPSFSVVSDDQLKGNLQQPFSATETEITMSHLDQNYYNQ